jgi:hypothetical protein
LNVTPAGRRLITITCALYAVGEFDEAFEAYQAAARIVPSPENELLLGTFAADIGESNLARDG